VNRRSLLLGLCAAALAPMAGVALGEGIAGVAGCTTHLLSDADKAKLENSVALEGQMYKDLAPEAGVPPLVLRAEAAGLYCSDEFVLEGSGKARPDAGLVCPKPK
jgi:hypothetical protein